MEEIINKHKQLNEELREENTQLKQKASKSLGELMTNTRNKTVEPTIQLIEHKNEIDNLTKEIQTSLIELSKQIKQWNNNVKKFEESLNEINNIESIGRSMETQINEIDIAVRNLVLNQNN